MALSSWFHGRFEVGMAVRDLRCRRRRGCCVGDDMGGEDEGGEKEEVCPYQEARRPKAPGSREGTGGACAAWAVERAPLWFKLSVGIDDLCS